MHNHANISALLLERYHIGEVTPEEKLFVEDALTRHPVLAASLADLDRADRDFRERFPRDRFFPGHIWPDRIHSIRRPRRVSPVVWGLSAAALVLAAVLPWLALRDTGRAADSIDRIKGESGYSAELSVYLKGGPENAGEGVKLPDQASVREGDTIQIAYRMPADVSGELYGVIFSIDGRSVVTMHYPYSLGNTNRLVSGRLVPLAEAYTLDDAPAYEIFFFVIGEEPLKPQNILNAARQFAPRIADNPQEALRQGIAAFKDYDLHVLTLRKE